jgi:hypothetical protein
VVVRHELASRLDRVVGQDADDRQPGGLVLSKLGEEQRELVATRHAGWSPEVDDNGSTAE